MVGLEARVHFVVVDIFDALHKIQYLVIKRRASAGGLMSAPSLTGGCFSSFLASPVVMYFYLLYIARHTFRRISGCRYERGVSDFFHGLSIRC